ncbi:MULTISPECIES: hypothetical protein [Bacillus subtilis group]|uniref:hypothetical protein n=1 Tax=Bacillus subtilis group TaxID=653685 RepID=UPI0009B7A112|nr:MULTISPECIES: hypothetical protein [Bacillus subtilis group]ARC67289.1 hypothetical protein B14_200078 [Bacillus licheniformis]ARW46070.1 hypothetical protein S100141_04850 [Bacillus licheniformis]MCY1628339.1 hypothetical protein [Bacillus paralicheniformis]MDE1421944.1 hypothetical protein [Bacillus licheniformis]MEC0475949.1 hypothetical protein [Bacillus licheniformis]
MDCTYQDECSNHEKSCFKCFNYNLYKPIKEKKGLNARSSTRKEKKEGMDFENRGTRRYNQNVYKARDVARRQVASGALHFALGDMITEEELTAALAEFKERGSKDAKGHKQITIKKEWLDKLEEEAKQMRRSYYFLPFTFKGSDKDYVALDYEILLSYVQTIQALLEHNRLLAKQIEDFQK